VDPGMLLPNDRQCVGRKYVIDVPLASQVWLMPLWQSCVATAVAFALVFIASRRGGPILDWLGLLGGTVAQPVAIVIHKKEPGTGSLLPPGTVRSDARDDSADAGVIIPDSEHARASDEGPRHSSPSTNYHHHTLAQPKEVRSPHVPPRDKPDKPTLHLHVVDHAKFFLNGLIIAHHVMCYVANHDANEWFMAFVNYLETFTMCLFSFLSGLLSKGELTSDRAKRTVGSVWSTYAICITLTFKRGIHFPDLYDQNIVVLWYLQCWIVWKMLLPFLRTVPDKRRLVGIAFAISWFGGYWHIERFGTFSAGATVAMLPFFVLGHALPLRLFDSVPRRVQRIAAASHAILCAGIFAVSLARFQRCDVPVDELWAPIGTPWTAVSWMRWVYGMHRGVYLSRETMVEYCPPNAVFCKPEYYLLWTQRVAYQLMALMLGTSFIFMMPDRPSRFSEHGRHSLYAYVLQEFCVLPYALKVREIVRFVIAAMLYHAGVDRAESFFFSNRNPLVLVCVILISYVCTFVLTSARVRSLACFAFEPTWLQTLLFDRKPTLTRQMVVKHGVSLLFFILVPRIDRLCNLLVPS